MVFAFPWLRGLPLAFCGRGARGAAATARAWLVAMSRACAASLARRRRKLLTSLSALAAQLSIIECGLRGEGWLGVVGDVSYCPSSAIGMCAGVMVAFGGQSEKN